MTLRLGKRNKTMEMRVNIGILAYWHIGILAHSRNGGIDF